MSGLNRAYKRRPSMVAMNGGPVLCLDAGSKLSYPGTGTTWTDLSGNGNNGTLTNGPTFDSANGGSIVFDGVNDYIDCGFNSTIYNLTSNFSVNIWIRWVGAVATTGNGQWVIANVDVSNTNGGFQLGYVPATGFIFSTYPGYAIPATYNVTPSINTWYNLSGVNDSVTGKSLYLNGLLVGSAGVSLAGTASRNLRIGHRERDSGVNFFPGKISQASVYNRALSAAEISTNFELLRGRYGI